MKGALIKNDTANVKDTLQCLTKLNIISPRNPVIVIALFVIDQTDLET